MSSLPDISGFLHEKQGFCHPDWDAIASVIEKDVPEDEWRPAWVAVARAWVIRNKELLGGDYQLYETDFLILSAAPLVDLSTPRPATLEFIATAHREDAGEAACQSVFELGLADLVTDFLGGGPWEPDPSRWWSEAL